MILLAWTRSKGRMAVESAPTGLLFWFG